MRYRLPRHQPRRAQRRHDSTSQTEFRYLHAPRLASRAHGQCASLFGLCVADQQNVGAKMWSQVFERDHEVI